MKKILCVLVLLIAIVLASVSCTGDEPKKLDRNDTGEQITLPNIVDSDNRYEGISNAGADNDSSFGPIIPVH